MGLLKNELAITTWGSHNKRYYENLGYKYTKLGDEILVKVGDLMRSTSILVKVKCDVCNCVTEINLRNYYDCRHGKTHNYSSENGEYICQSCGSKHNGERANLTRLNKSESLEHWCKLNLTNEQYINFINRWDIDKNRCTPDEVTFSSHGKNGFYFKCLDCPEHISEKKNIHAFVYNKCRDIICNQCMSVYSRRYDLVQYFINIEDSKKYTLGSNVKVPMICPFCHSKKMYEISKLSVHGFSCSFCNDSISYPNKFISSVLSQLNIEYDTEKRFDWCHFLFKGKDRIGVYDFYFKINDCEYIIEADGLWHFQDNTLSGIIKEESNLIDIEKENLAQKNGIKVIRIICTKSEAEFIKNEILHSDLNKLLNLSNVDWNECDKHAISSLLRNACDLYNQNYSREDISKQLHICNTTVLEYLKRGAKIGLCNYETRMMRKIICLNTKEVFRCSNDADSKYNINHWSILKNAKGMSGYAGKTSFGEKMHWKYYDEYLKSNELQIN